MDDQTYQDAMRVTVMPNGPYLVQGSVPLRRCRAIESEHGEPMSWATTGSLDDQATYALCRCGGSANKPFCDGTHKHNGFDGTETAATNAYRERATSYSGAGLTVRDDRGICEHAGFCGNRATNVWKMVGGAAVDDSVVRAQMIAMIEHCPSGALTFALGDGDAVEPLLAKAIGVIDDGPLFVTGSVPVQRSDGQAFEARNRVTLCRCGGSANKPLCDGTHKEREFRDDGTSA